MEPSRADFHGHEVTAPLLSHRTLPKSKAEKNGFRVQGLGFRVWGLGFGV